jgi:outer membrane protein assembly factor BamD
VARALTIALFCACASSAPPVDEELPSAQVYYERAQEKLQGKTVMWLFSDVDHPGAIVLFQEVIDNYPYSEYATLAELAIADAHYGQGNYEEAASFYQDFVELHPNHENTDYAIFRNGMCAFQRLREPDQDQTPTEEAIAQFQALLRRHPDSKYAPEGEQMLHEAEDRLALAIVAIGDFYFKRGHYGAAISRYREALSSYPAHEGRVETLAKLGIALKRIRHYYEAEELLMQVIALEPDDDDLLDRVNDELHEIETGGASGRGQVLPRSCVTDPNPACQPSD